MKCPNCGIHISEYGEAQKGYYERNKARLNKDRAARARAAKAGRTFKRSI